MNIKPRIVWEQYRHGSVPKDEDDDDEPNKSQIMNTPFGTFRVDDSMNPFKQFNFWLANTNFKITRRTREILNNIDGIEAVVFLTRYRFIVGIGKLFTQKDVCNAIDKALTKSFKFALFIKEDLNEKLSTLQNRLEEGFKFWAIYSFPNGNVDYVSNQSLEPVLEQFKLYKDAQVFSRGHIIISQELSKLMEKYESKNKQ